MPFGRRALLGNCSCIGNIGSVGTSNPTCRACPAVLNAHMGGGHVCRRNIPLITLADARQMFLISHGDREPRRRFGRPQGISPYPYALTKLARVECAWLRARKCLLRIGMKDLMMKKVHDERANSSRSLSRRKFLKVSATSAAIVGAGALSGCMYGSSMGAPGTTSKTQAHYQESPNHGRRCAGCTHFLKPNGCEIVAGEISPNGWCRFHRQA